MVLGSAIGERRRGAPTESDSGRQALSGPNFEPANARTTGVQGRSTGDAGAVPAGHRRGTDGDEAWQRVRELHHDLRQPLAAIGALAAAAAAQEEVPDTVLGCLDRIGEEARAMLDLCRHVLEQLASSQLVPVDVVAREVVASTKSASAVDIRLDAEPVILLTDPIELRRVLRNLVDNAERAAGPAGSVLVRVRAEGVRLRVEVGDSGPGFGNGPTGAAGIGLEVVERYARRHGGLLDIGSSALGGAAVGFTVDVASPADVIDDSDPTPHHEPPVLVSAENRSAS
jgi:signal transduction histidine kinase